ncbi:MAG: GGDEF domain-containing protein [Thiovulaceae bacterium]|jgi:EAL domain-containing protein (putative c-di-GMP-specific phosphodiesterase class I)/GGDEF domain-containing protein|nr:GGDEF domain-containing protein [Sulfurimonadaceae bacterium]
MQLPEIKEREYRFRLALRMGLPIFALMFALIFHTVITTYDTLNSVFYFEAVIVLTFGIYFIFYLIYSGFESKITDDVSKVFTRTYLFKYLKKDLQSYKDYTLILISVDNLNDINNRYGIKSGDKVLYEVALWIGKYLKKNNITNFPIGHVKGGDFILGLKGSSNKYESMLDLMCLKADEFNIDDIEVNILGAINDTSFSNDLDYMIENLFEIKELNKHKKQDIKFYDEDIKPNELENYIISAIKERRLILMKQDIYNENKVIMKECFVKLKRPDGKHIHQKSYMKILNKLRLMSDYDYMVLEQSIKKCTIESDITFAINISPTSLRNYNFLFKIKNLLENNPHVKNKIMFILNEKEYFSYTKKYSDIIKNIRNLGIKITIDKFGAYHSSFLYFRDFEVDAIRVDSIYTKEIKNDKYLKILDGFCTMAKKSDTKVWMKMVEDKETLNKINNMDVDYIQGKYLSELETIYES